MSDRMRGTIAAVVLAAVAFGGGYAVHHSSGPHCPTEDSCTVDYRGGAWHITRITP